MRTTLSGDGAVEDGAPMENRNELTRRRGKLQAVACIAVPEVKLVIRSEVIIRVKLSSPYFTKEKIKHDPWPRRRETAEDIACSHLSWLISDSILFGHTQGMTHRLSTQGSLPKKTNREEGLKEKHSFVWALI
ncbi:unnamed protein product [Arctogadus glacialis]